MYDFNSILEENENIVEQFKPEVGKGSKNITGNLVLIGFCIIAMAILIIPTLDNKNIILFLGIGIIFLGILLFLVIGIRNIIYTLIIKDKNAKNTLYCLTNKRILIYDLKKQKLKAGYLKNFDYLSVENKEDGYGDLILTKSVKYQGELKDRIKTKDDLNILSIILESIPNPSEMRRKIKELQNALRESGEMTLKEYHDQFEEL